MYYFSIEKKLSHYVTFVTLGHIFVMTLVYLLGSFNKVELNIDQSRLKVIQSSIRVDVVAMPKFTLKELKVMDDMAEADAVQEKKEIVSESGGDEEAALLKKTNFLDKLKKLSKKNINYKVKREKKAKPSSSSPIDSKQLRKLILAGNKLSKGSAISGTLSSENASTLQQYMERLPQIVRPHWKLPSFLKEKDLKCRIRIYISGRGEILKTEVIESSGEDQFDARALKALEQTNLPTPDKSIVKDLLKGIIILGFPL